MNVWFGWLLVGVSVGLLAEVVVIGPVSWLAMVGVGCVFLVGVALALQSKLVLLARRVAYAIREVRAAAKGEPEPPPPAPDLMATMAPMKAVPSPDLPPPKEEV